LRRQALLSSALLAHRMRSLAHPSTFQLGQPFRGVGDGGADADGHACEPHVSLFMLRVDEAEIGAVLLAVEGVAARFPAVTAAGHRWAHNPHGAPELYFHRSAQWAALQQAVIAAAEPLRRGRLRERDPAGARLADLIETLRRDGSDPPRLRQLLACGYDEIADAGDDRFAPHVTVAWPVDHGFRVDLGGLPRPAAFDAVLTDVAVFGMRPNGTCTRRYGEYKLSRRPATH
jgi:hypothetical protein